MHTSGAFERRRWAGVGISAIGAVLFLGTSNWLCPSVAAEKPAPPLPAVAPGWQIELVAQAPDILYPTAICCAPDGTLFVAQDPMDMPGPVTEPNDSILCIRGEGKDRKITTFASGLQAVMGMEYINETLYVVHAPFLSVFHDNGKGQADRRDDLITGFGPPVPGFHGLNDHIASGIKLGMDGFLYISVGDKGIPSATTKDGKKFTFFGGGVVRVRPDGTDLETVCTGQRNIMSVALDAEDNGFTRDNDAEGGWENNFCHVIDGGHFGWPWEFFKKERPHHRLERLEYSGELPAPVAPAGHSHR